MEAVRLLMLELAAPSSGTATASRNARPCALQPLRRIGGTLEDLWHGSSQYVGLVGPKLSPFLPGFGVMLILTAVCCRHPEKFLQPTPVCLRRTERGRWLPIRGFGAAVFTLYLYSNTVLGAESIV